MSTRRRKGLLAAVLFLLPLGCLQVEMTVEMHDDGGATITERVRFSEALLEMDATSPAERQLGRLLTREAAEARTKNLGKDARLVSHQVTDLPGKGRESLAVFQIPDIEDLRLPNPYLHQGLPARRMRLDFSPIYRFVHSFHRVGDVMLYLVPAEKEERSPGEEAAAGEPTPADLQALRDVQPMFADMLDDFQVKLTLVATQPISLGYVRDSRASTKVIELLSFTGEDLDAYGGRFVENEELMLSVQRCRMDADNLSEHASGFAGNVTLPVFRGKVPYGVGRFRLRPTKHLFQKFYAGRPKSQGGDVDDGTELPRRRRD